MGKLENKSVLITGADSGIGKAVALLFALEGAHIAIIYHTSDSDAGKTKAEIEKLGRECIIFRGDINDSEFCEKTVKEVISQNSEKLISLSIMQVFSFLRKALRNLKKKISDKPLILIL